MFAGLTVAENLRLAERARRRPAYDRVFALFPELSERGTAAGRHAVRRAAADARDRPGAAQRQPAAARRRADQGARAEGGDRGGRGAGAGRARRCRCCSSSRTSRSYAGWPATRSCWPPAGWPGPATRRELLGETGADQVAARCRLGGGARTDVDRSILLDADRARPGGAVLPGRVRPVAGLRPGRRAQLRARAVPVGRRVRHLVGGRQPAGRRARRVRLRARGRRSAWLAGARGRGRWSSWC